VRDLIDFDFCRQKHGFASDEDVLAWFLSPSPPDLRTFSPAFSPVDYLLSNLDVRKAGAHPIHHYLTHGFEEGRAAKPTRMLRAFGGADAAMRAMPAPEVRTAIVLHIFYPNFIDYFLRRVLALDIPHYDVFISAPADLVEVHGAAIRDALGDRLRELRVVPNQGRNFAPLFVEFGAALRDYDVICHCHSKQSLYSGRPQTEWADYLVNALLGAPDVVRRHINLIVSGACDLISPAPFIGIPPWASHSLSNDAHFRRLCGMVGVDGTTGFMVYPVGGMFWMSRGLYALMAGLNLTLDDFPTEPSQADGEVHHALERLIGRIAGPRQAFYDQVTSAYWATDAMLRAEMQRFVKVEDLCETIKGYDLVTFDFFDTLAVRSTGDEEWAKTRVEFVLGQNYVARRNGIEGRLRAQLGATGDVPLPMIAQELAGEGFADAARAVALERSLDLATLVPRPELVFAFEYAIKQRKDVLIISDSYYDRAVIEAFLRQHGISAPKDILMSADLGLRKDRGDLWDHVASLRGGRKAIHIGDNPHSDIQMAAARGFDTFFVPHWRHELLPFSGLNQALVKRNLTNPGFARSTDRLPPEETDDELSDEDLDIDTRRVSQRRRPAKNRTAR
jgi:FMN phosphatase YigB (HAD superfamily)